MYNREKFLKYRTFQSLSRFHQKRSNFQKALNIELIIIKILYNQIKFTFLDIKKAYDITDRKPLCSKFYKNIQNDNIDYKHLMLNIIDNVTNKILLTEDYKVKPI